jgi:hypothetical protein
VGNTDERGTEPADARARAAESLDTWNAGAERVIKRQARWDLVARVAVRAWPALRVFLLLGVLVLVVLLPIPSEPFSRASYVDENALQPGLTDVTFGHEEVKFADRVSARVFELARGGNVSERVAYVAEEFAAAGLDVYTQAYAYDVPSEGVPPRGINVYGRLNSPRTDGREAMIIAASWESALPAGRPDALPFQPHGRRPVNVRGVASVVTLAHHLAGVRAWSKDIIFVVSDGRLDGMNAWATKFFGAAHPHLIADAVDGSGARVWNAFALDYPDDSFSSLVVLHEGLNGQLPNLDTVNSVHRVGLNHARGIGIGIDGAEYEFAAQGAYCLENVVSWGLPRRAAEVLEDKVFGWGGIRRYFAAWPALWAQWRALLAGHPTGIHGVLLPYHVDAVTLYAVPASGPFGFAEMGRVSESLARTFSNLIERLHHSQFFYLLLSISRFVQISVYLVVPLVLGAVLTITGLRIWTRLAQRRDERRAALLDALAWQADDKLAGGAEAALGEPLCVRATAAELERIVEQCVPTDARGAARRAYATLGRPVWAALACVAAAHAGGLGVLAVAAHTPLGCVADGGVRCVYMSLAVGVSGLVPLACVVAGALSCTRETLGALAATLHAFALLHAGLVASVVATINVAQATTLAAVAVLALYPMQAVVGARTHARPLVSLAYAAHGLVLVLLSPVCVAAVATAFFPRMGAALEVLVWDWHVLQSAALPYFTVVFAPVIAEGAMAAFMYSVSVQ